MSTSNEFEINLTPKPRLLHHLRPGTQAAECVMYAHAVHCCLEVHGPNTIGNGRNLCGLPRRLAGSMSEMVPSRPPSHEIQQILKIRGTCMDMPEIITTLGLPSFSVVKLQLWKGKKTQSKALLSLICGSFVYCYTVMCSFHIQYNKLCLQKLLPPPTTKIHPLKPPQTPFLPSSRGLSHCRQLLRMARHGLQAISPKGELPHEAHSKGHLPVWNVGFGGGSAVGDARYSVFGVLAHLRVQIVCAVLSLEHTLICSCSSRSLCLWPR